VAGAFYFFNTMKQKIENGHYVNKYFTQIPNIIDDSKLDVYELRLLFHYYRVGECWEGVRTTAEKCRMSIGKVSAVRKTLEEKGFIKIAPSGVDGVMITVVDKSVENTEKYCSPREQPVHKEVLTRSYNEIKGSLHEHKNNQLRITIEEEGVCEQVIEMLNAVKKAYGINGACKLNDHRKKEIKARLNELKGEEPLKKVKAMIETMVQKWKGKDMQDHLNPDTLFRKSNFFRYIEMSEAAPAKDWTEIRRFDSLENDAQTPTISW
jgi:uncharacterized phage protein (TIGR02220 family)